MHNIDNIINEVLNTVESHKLTGEGEYARWIIDGDVGREPGINEYGCADAANILYTVGKFPSESGIREKWIKVLQGFQNPCSGLFSEKTHHPIHTTAHCVSALELFEKGPVYEVKALMPLLEIPTLYDFLDKLEWAKDPWGNSHRGAGIYSIMKLLGKATRKWEEAYFAWLWQEADEETGLWRRGYPKKGPQPLYHHLASTFHYMFNHEYAKRPLRYPERIIDTCLDMYHNKLLPEEFGHEISFLEVDWVYCLNRASRQTAYKYSECKEALKQFADEFIAYLNAVDKKTDTGWDDLHNLFGTVCALAELQQALYGYIISSAPLRLVLDRRPFI